MSTTTSSSSAPAPAAARSRGTWRLRQEDPAARARRLAAARAAELARADVFVDNRYVSADTWYDGDGKPFQPQIHYFVGGATKLYGAALYRLRAEDFGELRHHDGISPAWPISYDAMEPYYTRAEQLYQVHGARGEDPTEPPASAPYPFPASRTSRDPAALGRPRAAGYHPFHTPCGILLDETNMPFSPASAARTATASPARSTPSRTPRCSACGPRWSTRTSTLLTNARVVKLETNAAGTEVTEVVVEQDGETERLGGHRRRLVRRGQHAKLLLASANDQHPNGLANGSDQVGRNYMFHNSRPCSRSRRRRTRPYSRRRSG